MPSISGLIAKTKRVMLSNIKMLQSKMNKQSPLQNATIEGPSPNSGLTVTSTTLAAKRKISA